MDMTLRYKIIFKSSETIAEDQKLKEFVIAKFKQFGGKDLLSFVTNVTCDKNRMEIIIADKKKEFDVHASLFLCGKFGNVECCFVSE